MMPLKALLSDAAARLRESGVDAPEFDACELLLHTLGLERRESLLQLDNVEDEAVQRFYTRIERRCTRYPLQYLLGFWEFYGRRFTVREGVLIPRPETEILVEQALKLCPPNTDSTLLDLCSGSGAIALTLALENACAHVDALELSDDAISILRENATLLNAPVRILNADVCTYVPEHAYNLIVSNPPYICTQTCETLQPEVLFEPRMALCGGDDGMFFYDVIISRYHNYLLPGGTLLLEAGFGQASKIAALLTQHHYSDVTIQKDYAGIDRVVYASFRG